MFNFAEILNFAVYMINATLPAVAIAAGVVVGAWVMLRVYGWLRASF